MSNVSVASLKKGDAFSTPKGNVFDVLKISVKEKGDFHGTERKKYKLHVFDRQLRSAYTVHYMDTDMLRHEVPKIIPTSVREGVERSEREGDERGERDD